MVKVSNICFINGLEKLGLNVDYILNNYVCVGGDGYSRVESNKTNEYHINEFINIFGHKNFPEYVDKCICGHCIKENCYINDILNRSSFDSILIIGNCCYNKFINNKIRRCYHCNRDHTNNKSLCDECDKTIKQCNKEFRKLIKLKSIDMISSYNSLMNKEFIDYKKSSEKEYLMLQANLKIHLIDTNKLLQDYENELNSIFSLYEKNINLSKSIINKDDNFENNNTLNNKLTIVNRIFRLKINEISYIKYSKNSNYNILNIFNNNTLIMTINLNTLKETQKSKENNNNYKRFISSLISF